MTRLLFSSLLVLLSTAILSAQENLTLERAIELAHQNSAVAKAAKTTYENSSWAYRSYRADLYPSINLDATIPSLDRSFRAQPQPDGNQLFVPVNNVTSLANVRVNQNIGLTGGSVYMRTGLSRSDNPLSTTDPISYLSTPVRIGFSQNVFGFNNYKWLRQTEPLKFSESRQKYLEEMEEVSISAVNNFFDYYDAQMNLLLVKRNYANSDTLYKISKGRYQLGKIAEHELLQMELNLLTSRKDLQQAKLNLQNAEQNLKNFLGLGENSTINLLPPSDIDTFSVDPQLAISKAFQNRSEVLNMQRRTIESERDVAQAKSGTRPSISLDASYGISGRESTITDAYGNTLPQQTFQTSLGIPITNWGKNKANVKIAESNKELTDVQINMQKLGFEQEIVSQINQFNFRQQEYFIAAKSDTIGQKRYEVAYKRYLIGKIDITDLNLALQDKDRSKRSYLNALRNYWADYYRVRKLTLYDFKNNEDINE